MKVIQGVEQKFMIQHVGIVATFIQMHLIPRAHK